MRSRSPPLKGRGRGGVSNILRVNDIQTPHLAPPLEGRGAAAPNFATIMVFGVDSYIMNRAWTHCVQKRNKPARIGKRSFCERY